MTTEEAAGVKPGQELEARIGGEWVLVVAEERYNGLGPFLPATDRTRARLRCRRPGVKANGYRHGAMSKRVEDVRLVRDLDRVRTNVYADWLDDHGEHRAADLLRGAFPLADG